jgi:hypothetical protein
MTQLLRVPLQNQQSHEAFSCTKERNERRSLLSSINKEKTFTHRIFYSRRHLIPPNATVDEAHIPEQVSLSTRQYRPSFMPGDEHHQSVFQC